jgi:hypothetical protein
MRCAVCAALDELMTVAIVLKNSLRGEETQVWQHQFHATSDPTAH